MHRFLPLPFLSWGQSAYIHYWKCQYRGLAASVVCKDFDFPVILPRVVLVVFPIVPWRLLLALPLSVPRRPVRPSSGADGTGRPSQYFRPNRYPHMNGHSLFPYTVSLQFVIGTKVFHMIVANKVLYIYLTSSHPTQRYPLTAADGRPYPSYISQGRDGTVKNTASTSWLLRCSRVDLCITSTWRLPTGDTAR